MPDACLNCDTPLPDPRPKFCPACGQETSLKPPTLREFAQQFGGAYLSTEGALWRTLKLLLTKPGELTKQYLAGRRKHYVLPLRLYLTISVVVLLLLRLTASHVLHVADDSAEVTGKMPRGVTLKLGLGEAGLNDGQFVCNDLPQWVCKRLERRLAVDPKALSHELASVGERVTSNIGAAMFVLLPVFALGLKLAYWNRRLQYTEHLVFALHVHAFWFLMLALTLVDRKWLTGLATFAVPTYTMLSLRRVYGGRFWPRALRAIGVTALYGVTLVFTLLTLGWWALLF